MPSRSRRAEVKRRPNAKKRDKAKPQLNRVVLGAAVLGGIFGLALLVREILDYVADGNPAIAARRPYLQHNDLISALGSVAMLAFLGFVAYTTVRKANTSR